MWTKAVIMVLLVLNLGELAHKIWIHALSLIILSLI